MSLEDDDIESHQGGENLSLYHDDPNGNPTVTKTNSAKRLSMDAIDEKAEAKKGTIIFKKSS